jgi:MFS family permease
MRSARVALLVAVLGSSMAFLDSTVVNVALPVMQRELGASVTIVQWIVEAYALFLAALVLVGGALGDLRELPACQASDVGGGLRSGS